MLHQGLPQELPRVSERKNRSFAGKKRQILPLVQFDKPIDPISCLIFIHIPKTGGTNLVYVAESYSKLHSHFKTRRFAVPRVVNQSPGLIYENWEGGLKAAKTALTENTTCCESLNFISGHFPLGLGGYLIKPNRYIALVEDPVKRALSNTNFDYQRGYIEESQALDYLLKSEIDNPQTRILAGDQFMHGACNEKTLQTAKENIERQFLLIGVTEDVNSFIQVLASIQGWGPLAITRSQVTGDKVITDPNPSTVAALKAKHSIDCELYEYVKKRWYEWKKVHVKDQVTLNPNDTLLCIPSEFANTKTPLLLKKKEIDDYNSKVDNGLVESSQKHSGLDEDRRSKSHSLTYYGLRFAGLVGAGLFAYSLWKAQHKSTNPPHLVNTLRR